MGYFESCSPEELGISSDGICSFLDDIARKGLELHSLMVIRHGKCCAEGYFSPYGPDSLHPVFSFSKSLTATAIGFAEQEGLLSLDEKLVDLFPDELPENPSENLKLATIHDLLTMSCGQETEIRDHGPNWLKTFLAHPFPYKPGTFYQYNTAGTNVLSAILQKKTGQRVTEYLKPRLFDPLGITSYACARMNDAQGTDMGGAGMRLRTEDMAKFTWFMYNKGEWEGKKLLSGWYERAGSKQIETAGDAEGHVKEWAEGYGYQCWMCHLPGSFRADGAFGQFGFVFPSLDSIIVMTASTEQTQALIDSMYDYLISAYTEEPIVHFSSKCDPDECLNEILHHLSLPVLTGCISPTSEAKINGVRYLTTASDGMTGLSGLEVLTGGSGIFDLDYESEITSMAFTFDGREVTWTVTDNGRIKMIRAAMDHRFAYGTFDGKPYAAAARWRDEFVLEMEVRRLDALSGSRLIFRFEGDTLRLDADETLITSGSFGKVPKHVVPFIRK